MRRPSGNQMPDRLLRIGISTLCLRFHARRRTSLAIIPNDESSMRENRCASFRQTPGIVLERSHEPLLSRIAQHGAPYAGPEIFVLSIGRATSTVTWVTAWSAWKCCPAACSRRHYHSCTVPGTQSREAANPLESPSKRGILQNMCGPPARIKN